MKKQAIQNKGKLILYFLVISLLLFNCKQKPTTDVKPKELPRISKNEHLLMATLWQQKAAEYRALAYQAFNIAKKRIDEDSKIDHGKKNAIIVDIDETVLDNSPFQATNITADRDYPQGWNEWCDKAIAKEVPGAIDCLKYAVSKGYDVFYISNRKVKLLEGTMKNLQDMGFPQANEEHILLRGEIKSKEPRREKVAETHYISILMGDNLGDFSEIYDYERGKTTVESRFKLVDDSKEKFGAKFIMLPNAMYGSWVDTVLEGNWQMPREEMLKYFENHLEEE